MATDPELLWQPAHPEKAQASLFRDHINKKYNLNLGSYEELWKWSCNNRGDYWSEVWDWEGVVGDKGAAPVSVLPTLLRTCRNLGALAERPRSSMRQQQQH